MFLPIQIDGRLRSALGNDQSHAPAKDWRAYESPAEMFQGRGEKQDLLWNSVIEEAANTHVNTVHAFNQVD